MNRLEYLKSLGFELSEEELQEGEAPGAVEPKEEAAEAEPGTMELSEERVAQLLEEEARIRERDPGFDVVEFARSSELVAALIVMGFGLEEIVREFSGERALKAERERAETELITRIRERNALPASLGIQGEAQRARSVAAMSDEEIRAIDRAVKAGKKVRL